MLFICFWSLESKENNKQGEIRKATNSWVELLTLQLHFLKLFNANCTQPKKLYTVKTKRFFKWISTQNSVIFYFENINILSIWPQGEKKSFFS